MHAVVVGSDGELLGQVERAAAAASVPLQIVAPADVSRQDWRLATQVLITMESLAAVHRLCFPRRDGVVVIGRSAPEGDEWARCIELGVGRVIAVEGESAELVEALAGGGLRPDTGSGRVMGFVSASGGAGSSLLAVATAVAATRQGRRTLLADCDQWGAGLDVVIGAEEQSGLCWGDLIAPAGRLPADELYQSLPTWDTRIGTLPLLVFGRGAVREIDPAVATTVISTARRSGDLAIVDLPRMRTPVGEALTELADVVVVVVTADVRSVHAAHRQVEWLRRSGVTPGLVVRGPSPGGLGADDIAETLQVPLLAAMRPDRKLLRDLEFGRPPGVDASRPLGRAARTLLRTVDPVAV